MAANQEFTTIFNSLKSIMKKYQKGLTVIADKNDNFCLNGPFSEKFKKDLWFGAVQIKKNYVSYHLMPVYMYKELADSIPDNLKKRMQGKSCFNFKKVDEKLFKELDKFTGKSYKMFFKKKDDISMSY